MRARFVVFVLALLVWGCQSEPEVKSVNPTGDINLVLKHHADDLMGVVGVTAVGVGATAEGKPCLKVYVVERTDEIEKQIPSSLEGFPVVVEVSGEIKPLDDN